VCTASSATADRQSPRSGLRGAAQGAHGGASCCTPLPRCLALRATKRACAVPCWQRLSASSMRNAQRNAGHHGGEKQRELNGRPVSGDA
jgi:hypothetical protein